MPSAFISYRRVDSAALATLIAIRLNDIHGIDTYVDTRNTDGGGPFPDRLRGAIERSDVFVSLLGATTLESAWVQTEIEHAYNLRKTMIPVFQERYVAPSPPLSSHIEALLQSDGVQFLDVRNLYIDQAITQLAEMIKNSTPRPVINPSSTKIPFYRRPVFLISLIALVAILLLAIVIPTLNPSLLISTPTTNESLNPSDTSVPTQPKASDMPTITVTPAPTSTVTTQSNDGQLITASAQIPTADASIQPSFGNGQIYITVKSNGDKANIRSSTDSSINNIIAFAYNDTRLTVVDIQFEVPNDPNSRAWFKVKLIGDDGKTVSGVEFFNRALATGYIASNPVKDANAKIDEIILTLTAYTAIPTITVTFPTETPTPLGLPGNPVTKNADWKPVYQTFDGFEMALVPVGCFMMGSDSGYKDEKPVDKQCFDQPFWIDRYEVTNKQYGSQGEFKGDNRPRDSVTWFQARDFCENRSARLPTEREWEYAARGPNNYVYPWGNNFMGDRVVYQNDTSNDGASDVGSRPLGNSWVGASDLSGNVWEWVSTVYGVDKNLNLNFDDGGDKLFTYPYTANDGRENDTDDIAFVRVLRGGSWFKSNSVILRASSRHWSSPSYQSNIFGFRCARSFEE